MEKRAKECPWSSSSSPPSSSCTCHSQQALASTVDNSHALVSLVILSLPAQMKHASIVIRVTVKWINYEYNIMLCFSLGLHVTTHQGLNTEADFNYIIYCE